MNDTTAGPRQQRRDDEADALPAPCRREAQHVLRSIVTQVLMIDLAEHDTIGFKKPAAPISLVVAQRADP